MISFTKQQRVRHKKEFRRIFQAKRKFHGKYIIIDYCLSETKLPKLGISVSSKYAKAHLRNRFKRVVRSAFRQSYNKLPSNLEINISPQPLVKKIKTQDIQKDLLSLIIFK